MLINITTVSSQHGNQSNEWHKNSEWGIIIILKIRKPKSVGGQ